MNKVIRVIVISAFVFAPFAGFTQSGKITAQISLIDSFSKDASQYTVRVVIKNNSKGNILVQNIDYIKSLASAPGRNCIYPFLEREDSGKLKRYEEKYAHYSYLPDDTCMWNCCNCYVLGKGKAVNIDLKILQCYMLIPGRYRLQIGMIFPFDNFEYNKDVSEIFSNYLYFTTGK